ncbi:hypothetical protein MVEG_11423 [Podila verticillata NRRL 6337]|uniref:Uncharacterized protein n=1 Tax=Podila verticillata NRRL 6337 TaxID=1069443 RepID=A0A086TLS2_9FUNG|nr:hypothetical protein MVEG_11423 [Podila verticillata NRRL 6337]
MVQAPTMNQPRKRRQTQPSITLSSPSSYSYSRLSLAFFTLALALSTLSTVSASITCALPAGGTYKAGDSIILDWGSDGTMPVVTDISSINGTLYCNSGAKIADVSIPNLTGPYNWTVPGVGNATTVGGTQGVCAMNAFHIEYSGEAWGFLHAIQSPWGPVRCGTITIMPAGNGTVTTTTTTMSMTTTTTSSSPTETSPSSDGSTSGGLSTVVIVVIAVVAAVLLTLSIVGLVWYLRKQKKRRLAVALGPWALDSGSNRMHVNNAQHSRFSKVSTLMDHDLDDEPHGSPSALNNRPLMAAAGASASAVTFGLKPQPTLPGIGPSNRSSRQSQQQQHQSYYGEIDFADYGYQLPQQQQLNQGGFNNNGYHLPGYNADGNNGVYQHNNASNQSVGEEDYYNPYYAHRHSLQQQQQYQQSMQMMGMNQGNPSFYSQHSTGSNVNAAGGVPPLPPPGVRPYSQDVRYSQVPDTQFQAGAQAQQGGYFPPPPPKSNARGGAPGTGGITSLQSGSTLSLSSSPKRGPQGANVMSEMGSQEATADGGGGEKVLVQEEAKMEDIKMEDIKKEEVKSDDEDMETTPLTTTTTTVSSSTVDMDEKVKEA